MPQTIAFLIFDEFQILDAAGPMAAFEMAARYREPAAYDIRVIARKGGLVTSSSQAMMHAESISRPLTIDTLIVAGGLGTKAAAKCQRTLAFIRNVSERARRICSVCTGAYILAATGLLDNRLATTHWELTSQFARTFPKVRLEPDRIYTRDGNVWTSAGVSAGIDLALALIGDDLGEAAAKQVARQLIVYYQRSGGQSQFSTLLEEGLPQRSFRRAAWLDTRTYPRRLTDRETSRTGQHESTEFRPCLYQGNRNLSRQGCGKTPSRSRLHAYRKWGNDHGADSTTHRLP